MDDPLLRRLGRISQPQAGCITTAQLRAAGCSDGRIFSLVSRGALAPITHTVYLFGAHRLTDAALLHAACLRGGTDARLAERTGLAVRGLVRPDPGHVVVWRARRRTRVSTTVQVKTHVATLATGGPATIEIRDRRHLGLLERVGDLPVSTPIDALVGFASRGHSWELTRAWREADFRSLLSVEAVEARIGRGIEGSTVIRELMARHPIVGTDVTLLSRAERRLLAGIARRGLGSPAVNQSFRFNGHLLRPDFFYIDAQLAVEILGGGHDSPARQREDLERARIMRAAGVEVLEITDDEVVRQLEACLDLIDARRTARLRERRAAA